MAKTCKYCGMVSDDEGTCAWCGKAIAEARPTALPRPTPGAAPGAPAPGEPGGQASRATHAGAARAMMQAEAARRERNLVPYYLIGAGVLLVILLGANLLAYLSAAAGPAEAADWQQVQVATKELSLEVPGNWKLSTGGAVGTATWCSVKSGKLNKVYLHGSQVGGIMADVAAAQSRAQASMQEGQPLSLENRPEGKMHVSFADRAKREDPAFQDSGDMQACTFAGQPAAWSYYTSRKRIGLFTIALKGMRLTCPLSGDYCFDVRSECPAKHWEKLQPTANRILGSVQRPQG